jgi:hypothetical protein
MGELKMSDTTILETSPPDERQRIWQTYRAGRLSVEAATVRLLRLDIDCLARARELSTSIRLVAVDQVHLRT